MNSAFKRLFTFGVWFGAFPRTSIGTSIGGSFGAALSILLMTNAALADGDAEFTRLPTRSDLRVTELRVSSVKYPDEPNDALVGDAKPIHTWAWSPTAEGMTGFTELIPFAIASPDQEDAGSCLYMSLTGIAEWWLARLNPMTDRRSDGALDLSERWMMNLANDRRYLKEVSDWRTDSIALFNSAGGSVLNSNYRFTKGWYERDSDGDLRPSTASKRHAQYDTSFNWIDNREQVSAPLVRLPKFKRDVLFADPEHNQWNLAVMPDNIVKTVKQRLVKKKAPVQVLYNHFGYWHAAVIVGFDDQRDTKGCEFVQGAREYFKSKPRFEAVSQKLEARVAAKGACNPNGVFYVRDSIYGDDAESEYVYDPSRPNEGKGRYSKRIIMLEYNWLNHLANHAIQIYPERRPEPDPDRP